MKIVASHLLNFLKEKPKLDKLSNILFQLGHEHEIEGEILDLEITPTEVIVFRSKELQEI